MEEFGYEPNWLQKVIDESLINCAMSQTSIDHLGLKLKGRHIKMLRKKMKDQFKLVTGEDL